MESTTGHTEEELLASVGLSARELGVLIALCDQGDPDAASREIRYSGLGKLEAAQAHLRSHQQSVAARLAAQQPQGDPETSVAGGPSALQAEIKQTYDAISHAWHSVCALQAHMEDRGIPPVIVEMLNSTRESTYRGLTAFPALVQVIDWKEGGA